MSVLVKQLESQLGPDTGTLQMRFGINSGSVTAGVLRGDKGRFQVGMIHFLRFGRMLVLVRSHSLLFLHEKLFGDTMNTGALLIVVLISAIGESVSALTSSSLVLCTASRMESTGAKNKVQVSQATADRLIADGKEKWLTEREGKHSPAVEIHPRTPAHHLTVLP